MLISKYFSWHDAIFLPQWNREATEEDGLTDAIRANLTELFARMDVVREYFNKPILVHVTYRPAPYNALIGGAKNSAHIEGKACDFHIQGIVCDDAREDILKNGLLEKWGMRMEAAPGTGWIHLDTREPAPDHPRCFLP